MLMHTGYVLLRLEGARPNCQMLDRRVSLLSLITELVQTAGLKGFPMVGLFSEKVVHDLRQLSRSASGNPFIEGGVATMLHIDGKDVLGVKMDRPLDRTDIVGLRAKIEELGSPISAETMDKILDHSNVGIEVETEDRKTIVVMEGTGNGRYWILPSSMILG